MTVRQLIAALQLMPQDVQVTLGTPWDDGSGPANAVEYIPQDARRFAAGTVFIWEGGE